MKLVAGWLRPLLSAGEGPADSFYSCDWLWVGAFLLAWWPAMAKPVPSKHTVYFEVLEALHEEGCPVCRLGLRAVWRYLDGLSYEGVNDPRSRAELRAARGFCCRHAWQFAKGMRDGLGTAIIYRDVIGELLHILRGAGGRGLHSPAGLAARLAPQRACPACRLLAESCHRYLDTLLSHLSDDGFRAEYLASSGLCLPHLAAGLQRTLQARHRGFLAEAFARRFAPSGDGSARGLPLDGGAIVEAMVGVEGATPLPRPVNPMAGQRGGAVAVQEPLRTGRDADGEGCPVCRTVGPAMERWLAQFAGAPVAADAPQPGRPPALLCNAHAWRLLRVAGARDAANLLQPQALAIAGRLRLQARRVEPATGWRRLLGLAGRAGKGEGDTRAAAVPELGHCPACDAQAASERWATLAVCEAMCQGPRSASGRPAPQLCLTHLRLGLSLPEASQQMETLAAAQTEVLQALHQELGEYIRKQDYRFRQEPLRTEASAPWRAVAQVAGGSWP